MSESFEDAVRRHEEEALSNAAHQEAEASAREREQARIDEHGRRLALAKQARDRSFSGTLIESVFNEADSSRIAEFLELMKSRGFARGERLFLDEVSRGRKAFGRVKEHLVDSKSVTGYTIGVVACAPGTKMPYERCFPFDRFEDTRHDWARLYVCSDSLLRAGARADRDSVSDYVSEDHLLRYNATDIGTDSARRPNPVQTGFEQEVSQTYIASYKGEDRYAAEAYHVKERQLQFSPLETTLMQVALHGNVTTA